MKITITWRYSIGIDISKKVLDIYLYDQKTQQGSWLQVPNNPQGFAKLGRWLTDQNVKKSQAVLCSEPCGRYGEHLLEWSTRTGWPHAVLNTTALGKVGGEHHRKDDAYDARGLAEYGRRYSDKLRLVKAPKPAVKQLKRLRAERRAMVDQRAALRQKLSEATYHDADMSQLVELWSQQVALLSEHITQLQGRIATLIRQDDYLSQTHRRLLTAPGIGPVIGCFWLTLFAGQEQLNPRKISSRFGFAPHPYRSGSSVRKPDRSSRFGNGEMRRLMHQAARSVATHKPHYRAYYKRKIDEGKPELVVINNIINKLIHLYCAMWNNQADYNPNHIEKMKNQRKKSA